MLLIKTDIVDRSWLRYIIDEFIVSNKAQFPIEIVDIDSTVQCENIIHYSNTPKNGVSVYQCGEKKPSPDILFLSKSLYVIKDSVDELFTISYDLFWNAFVFLSRYEEYLSEKTGRRINSYCIQHPRSNKDSFEIPIVNHLFNELEDLISRNYSLPFGERADPYFDLSHDVDYIEKTIQLRLKQSTFNMYNTIKNVFRPKHFLHNLLRTVKFLFSNPSYWCFDYWENLETRLCKTSTFYVYVKTGKKTIGSWLIDPSYNLEKNKLLQDKLKSLKQSGFQIGLHGSFKSALDFEQLKREKEELEEILGTQVTKTRQHWLNYHELFTPEFHERLFKSDSTIGWNDRMGFRSGIANKYRPYNFLTGKTYSYMITPLLIMDSHTYDYAKSEQAFSKSMGLIEIAKTVSKATSVSISWHQRVASADYRWNKHYEELLNVI